MESFLKCHSDLSWTFPFDWSPAPAGLWRVHFLQCEALEVAGGAPVAAEGQWFQRTEGRRAINQPEQTTDISTPGWGGGGAGIETRLH